MILSVLITGQSFPREVRIKHTSLAYSFIVLKKIRDTLPHAFCFLNMRQLHNTHLRDSVTRNEGTTTMILKFWTSQGTLYPADWLHFFSTKNSCKYCPEVATAWHIVILMWAHTGLAYTQMGTINNIRWCCLAWICVILKKPALTLGLICYTQWCDMCGRSFACTRIHRK